MNRAPEKKDAKAIFSAAIEYYMPDQWEGYLVTACGDDEALKQKVRELLEAHRRSDSFLDGAQVTEGAPVAVRAGSQIGPYKLLQEIGEGGFGVVYMAEQQEPVRRKVALKIIKPGMDTKQVIARFEAERQALAMMDHPNIAKVLGAGATDSGRPYFVMELVKGVPVTEFCDSNKLSTQERLDLFITVCRAVQHAHQKGVIHRDIKPSNVMVTLHDNKPMPVIIDFGVSKAISHQLTAKTLFTAYGQMVGTPAYMSPEQAQMSRMDIDTRSDIYSLGVLLYELLTGSTPLDADQLRGTAYAELQRLIREEEAPKPSTRVSTLGKALARIAQDRGTDPKRLGQFLRGDLDWIVMKALEKERSRRYDSANGLANDIERFLKDEAVEACPPSLSYQCRKFVGRNRGLVTTASLVLAATLLGIIGTTIGMLQARRDAGVARIALADADQARELASRMAKEKELEAELAIRAKEEADRLRDQAKVQAAKQLMMRASAERDKGDVTLAALLGAEALRQDSGDPERELNHRRRLAADLRQCPRPTQLLFHDSPVQDARFSGDGKWIVTTCDDGSVRIFDAETGAVKRTFQHEGRVSDATFLLDDTRLVTHERVEDADDEFKESKIHLWDWRSGKSLAVAESVHRVPSSNGHRGEYYAIQPRRGELQIISAQDGQPVGSPIVSDWTIQSSWTFGTKALLTLTQQAENDPELPLPPGRPRRRLAFRVELREADTGGQVTLYERAADPARGFGRPTYFGTITRVVSPANGLIALGVDGSINIYKDNALLHRVSTREGIDTPNAFGQGFRRVLDAVPKAFSPDGRTLVCRLGADIILVDVDRGEIRERIVLGSSRTVSSQDVEFNPDSNRILTLNQQGHPQIWDVWSGQVLSPPLEHESVVRDFGFSPDGRYVQVISSSGTIRIWDTLSEELTSAPLRHAGNVQRSNFSRDGSHLLVAVGNTVYLWPVGLPEFSQVAIEYPASNSPIMSRFSTALISPDGARIITQWQASNSFRDPAEMRVWDAATGELIHPPHEAGTMGGGISGLMVNQKFSTDGQFLAKTSRVFRSGGSGPAGSGATTNESGNLMWNLVSGERVPFETEIPGPVIDSGFSRDNSIAWITFTSRDLGLGTAVTRIFDPGTGKPLGPPIEHLRGAFGVMSAPYRREHVVSPDGSFLAGIDGESASGRIRIFDTRTGNPIGVAMEHGGPVVHLALSADARRLLSVSREEDQLIARLWDVATTHKQLHQCSVRFRRQSVNTGIDLDPTGRRFAAFSSVRSSSVRSRRGSVSTATPESARIVTVCDLETNQSNRLHHDLGVVNVAFSPDGMQILTNCADRVIRVWDSESGELVRVLESPGTSGTFGDSRFSTDGRRVIAVSENGVPRIWDVTTGQSLTPNQRANGDNTPNAFNRFLGSATSTDCVNNLGDRFVVKENGRFVVYDLSADARPAEDLMRVARVLSGRGINPLGNVETLPPQLWRQEWNETVNDVNERLLAARRGQEWHRRQIQGLDQDFATFWHINRLIDAGADDSELYLRRGKFHVSQDRHEEAIEDFNAAEESGQFVADVRATSLARLNRWAEAATDFEATASSPTEPRAQLRFQAQRANIFKSNAGVAYLSAGNNQAYERVCSELLTDPDDRTPGYILHVRLGLLVPRSDDYCRNLQERVDALPSSANSGRGIPLGIRKPVAFDELMAFRRGEFEAVLAMNRSGDANDGTSDLFGGRLAIQAMACKQLGQDERASELLKQATDIIQAFRRPPIPDPSAVRVGNPGLRHVIDWQIAMLLKREAAEMIQGKQEEADEHQEGDGASHSAVDAQIRPE